MCSFVRMTTMVALVAAALQCEAATTTVRPRAASSPPQPDPVPATQSRRGLDVPVLGWTEWNGALRPIVGLRGAPALGWRTPLQEGVSKIAVAPSQSYAIVQREGAPLATTVIGPSDTAGLQEVAGALTAPDRIVFSPTGSAALLYSNSERRIDVLTGLPARTRVRWQADLSALGDVADLAVSDDGTSVLAATPAGHGPGIWLLAAGTEPRLVVPRTEASVVRFVPNRSDALIADPAHHSVALVANVRRTAAIQEIASASAGIDTPVDLLASADGQHILVAQSAGSGLLVVNRADGSAARVQCPFSPERLLALRDAKAVGVLDRDSGEVWLWDLAEGIVRAVALPVKE